MDCRDSREGGRSTCPPEEKVLETLASIKSHISSVLKDIQGARESAAGAESVCKRVNMEGIKETGTPKPLIDTPTSRDDVKAQREAKKAAKAARKGKGSVVEPSPILVSPTKPSPAPPPATTPTNSRVPLSSVSPVAGNAEETEQSPKTKAQLKAERRALQEAQREAKVKTPKGDAAKEYSSLLPKTLEHQVSSSVISPSLPRTPETLNGIPDAESYSPSAPRTPDNQGISDADFDSSSPPTTPENKRVPMAGSTSELSKKISSPVCLPSRPKSAPNSLEKNTENNREDNEEDNLESGSNQLIPKMGKIHGLFEWDADPLLDEEIPELELVEVDPMFKELGLMYSSGMIRGSNKRTVALLRIVKQFIKNYRTPDGKGFKPDLSTKLKYSFDRLKLSRPFAVGMSSAVDGLNEAIRRLEEGLSDENYKMSLNDWCDAFIEEKVEKAVEAIAQKGCEKIVDGDTILVFSLTDVIYHVFKLAGEQGTKFHLLLAITNSDTYLNDYEQLRNNMGADVFKKNVLVSCINISSIMSLISSVNKVFLGGHALFTTGGVMAHAGSSTIALCAMQHNIPTLFFCETFKFCDKSPTDAFYRDVFFENKICLTNDRKKIDEDLNNSVSYSRKEIVTAKIRYDFTPVNLVTCVITDIDMLPSSSVPVVLRVQETRPLTKCL